MGTAQTHVIGQPERRWLIFLVALFTLLCAAVFSLKTFDRQRTALGQLMHAQQVQTINISAASGEVVLQREQDQWHMRTPHQAPANADRIAALLSLLTLPARTAYDESEVDLRELGLHNPVATIMLNDLRFDFGNLTVSDNTRYIKVNGKVHLYNELVYPLINAGSSALLENAQSESSISIGADSGAKD